MARKLFFENYSTVLSEQQKSIAEKRVLHARQKLSIVCVPSPHSNVCADFAFYRSLSRRRHA